jgi:hypothetical protein
MQTSSRLTVLTHDQAITDIKQSTNCLS